MDVQTRLDLIQRFPVEEVVTSNDLQNILETNNRPKHYIGLEVSGFLHLGSLITSGYKINDLVEAGVDCTVFLADWHTVINDKLGGSWEAIRTVSQYYANAFKAVCPGAKILMGSELYESRKNYWAELVNFAKHMSLARTRRTLTIMGRDENQDIDLAKLLYPPMQAIDIHNLDVDIAHAGMDQRKIHMLAREIFPKMGWKVPVAIHHKLLPGLSRPVARGTKMSKSDPNSGIFMHDSDDTIRTKIKKAWCEEGNTVNNPLLELVRVLFRDSKLEVERPSKFGGNVTYCEYEELMADFATKKLHPADLKRAVAELVVSVVSPIRESINLDSTVKNIIESR